MFTVREVNTPGGRLQYRTDLLTGLSCRISTARLRRGIDQAPQVTSSAEGCPFCPERLEHTTPVFSDGRRIVYGESVTFPNLFPFGAWHTVTVISRAHTVERFSAKQLLDAFSGQIESLEGHEGFPSINWNYLPSAGASIAHPHIQGLVDQEPSFRVRRCMEGGKRYLQKMGRSYWDDMREAEMRSTRQLLDGHLFWFANPVPMGEREVLCILPFSHLDEMKSELIAFVEGLLCMIDFYRTFGTSAFNLSIFFEEEGEEHGFRAFSSMIARINPNTVSLSDSSFMERLHLEPLILTMPEEMGPIFRRMQETVSPSAKSNDNS
ncbi:MAG: galactose-1-phosphate uridylyltransferase [Methanomicrobiales archaeon]|nr:galactose-1-phosphate uridylyltransferase [Methanomicrobiales archaeon]